MRAALSGEPRPARVLMRAAAPRSRRDLQRGGAAAQPRSPAAGGGRPGRHRARRRHGGRRPARSSAAGADRELVEGSVNATVDAISAGRRVPHRRRGRAAGAPCAIAAPGLESRRSRSSSHPQALAQCARSCARSSRRRARAVDVDGRGGARVGRPRGATGGGDRHDRAAKLYGCSRARRASRTSDGNATRFVWLAPAGSPPGRRRRKTSLVFSGGGAGKPGWLVRCLSEFAFRGVNLTRIESRPRKDRRGLRVLRRPRRVARRARRGGGRRGARPLRQVRVLGLVSGRVAALATPLLRATLPLCDGDRATSPSRVRAAHEHRRRGRSLGGCSSSTRRTSRSTCAPCGVRPCCS